jgi:hypothetical protein
MPRNRRFRKSVRTRMAVTGENFTAARAALDQQPSYFPGYGWRAGMRGRSLAVPVEIERDGVGLRVVQLLVTREGVDVLVEFSGLPAREIGVDAPLSVALAVATRPTEWVSATRIASGGSMARFEVNAEFPGIGRVPEAIALRVTGDIGDWYLDVPLRPATGEPGFLDDFRYRHRAGVHLEIAGVVRRDDRLVLQVVATGDPPIGLVRGLGTRDPIRMPGDELKLRDDLGNEYTEVREPDASRFQDGHHHTIVFGGVRRDAASFELSIPFVTVAERSEDVTVDLPPATGLVRLGRHQMRLLGWRPSEGQLADFYPITLHLEGVPSGPFVAIRPEQVLVNGQGVAMSFPTREGTQIAIQTPATPPLELRLRHVLVQVSGPWALTFTVPMESSS